MNSKVLKTLEYEKIIDQLVNCAGSLLGKELCKHLVPSSDIEEIRTMQHETSLALARIYQKGSLSFSGVYDIRGSLKRLEVGSILSTQELLHISKMLDVCSRAKSYDRKDNDEAEPDALDVMFQALQPLAPLAGEIRRCILSEDDFHGEWLCQNLSSGCRDHHAKRPLLSSGKGGIPWSDTGYDSRPVIHWFYSIYRTNGCTETE